MRQYDEIKTSKPSMIQCSRFCSTPERTAKSQEQMSNSCWVSAQPVLHDASGTWLRVNSSGRSEKQEISDTPYMTCSIIESPTRNGGRPPYTRKGVKTTFGACQLHHETKITYSEPRPPRFTMGDFYTRANASALHIVALPVRSIVQKSARPLRYSPGIYT